MKKYRPSNSSEFEGFAEIYCYQCLHERWHHFMEDDNEEDKCEILTKSLVNDDGVDEWVYSDHSGLPTCLKFQYHNWDNGEPDVGFKTYNITDENQLNLF